MFDPLSFIRRNGSGLGTTRVKAHGFTVALEGVLERTTLEGACQLAEAQKDVETEDGSAYRVPVSASIALTDAEGKATGRKARITDTLTPKHAAQFIRGEEDSKRVQRTKSKAEERAAAAPATTEGNGQTV